MAFDKDAGENGQLEYSITENTKSQGRFRIHPSEGTVYSQKSLNAGQEFAFNVSKHLDSCIVPSNRYHSLVFPRYFPG